MIIRTINSVTLTLIIVGAINWGVIAFFQLDFVAALFGGQDAFLSRVVYGIIGLSGLYYLTKTLYPIGIIPTVDTIDGNVRYSTEVAEEYEGNRRETEKDKE
ncbi:DUF378 domain-containing protein [Oceanobacillus caeni]|uniref:DUF378 domain-containing protein n=1 Tax=Oceanobacillus caeni TaxID=405946 RepID=UPI000A07D7AF|nr:DUF378 domain-containing protein [Oceanobacillus caeni]PZD83437.1 DUF378 domain-containing protein [Bacilli bacterium]MCR1835353.1 DUF378 domain-containing protein [Oceanobacillus caeni]PZD84222.1 DUF378 domain-containing protein [Bacilli bacterium]PZD87442.1 DUF378 domain-containing protein [Bacilli bacterium]RCO05128.1 DUF378 domain-containing protein [Bacilli bacterium]